MKFAAMLLALALAVTAVAEPLREAAVAHHAVGRRGHTGSERDDADAKERAKEAEAGQPGYGPFSPHVFNTSYNNFRFYRGCFAAGQQLWQGNTQVRDFPRDNMQYCSSFDVCGGFHIYVRNDTDRNNVFIEYKRSCNLIPAVACPDAPFGRRGGGAWYAMVDIKQCPGVSLGQAMGSSDKTDQAGSGDDGECVDRRNSCAHVSASLVAQQCTHARIRERCPRLCGVCTTSGPSSLGSLQPPPGADQRVGGLAAGGLGVIVVGTLLLATWRQHAEESFFESPVGAPAHEEGVPDGAGTMF